MGPRILIALACTASLATGLGLGVALDRALAERRRAALDHEAKPARAASYLERRLDLDAAQTDRVRAILEARWPKFEEIMNDVRPRLRALHVEMDAEIRALLRPEQAAKLEELRRREFCEEKR